MGDENELVRPRREHRLHVKTHRTHKKAPVHARDRALVRRRPAVGRLEIRFRAINARMFRFINCCLFLFGVTIGHSTRWAQRRLGQSIALGGNDNDNNNNVDVF